MRSSPDHSVGNGRSLREALFCWPQRGLTVLLLAALAAFAVSWWRRGALPYAHQIHPDLNMAPIQEKTTRDAFAFEHLGARFRVTPLAEYEMWGLVVSHNDINSFADIYHDENSVDVKDLCTIWGSNVETNDFRKVQFKSDCYVCRFRYRSGTKFNHAELANTHLLSSDPEVLRGIGAVRKADQIRLKGVLVNYRAEGTTWERKSSLTRKDTGMGACEVMFVEEVEVLRRGTPMWYAAFDAAKIALILFVVLKIGLLVLKTILDQRDFQNRVDASSAY